MAIGLVALVAMAAPGHCAWAQNLVVNPGFEESTDSSDSTGWILAAADGQTSFFEGENGEDGAAPHSGDWFASFAALTPAAASAGKLTQMITTVPGETYLVSFFLANESGPTNSFLAKFGATTVLSLTDSPAFGYTEYSMAVTATSARTQLSFQGEQVPAEFALDDVSVTLETDGAPAPVTGGGIASFVVLVIAFMFHRLRRRAA